MLIHRGPDADGLYVDDFAAMGHRRLSIIDLDTGAQPMSTPDGGLHIVFNGEIYNFPELRRELESRGHRFRTRSDTEVILLGYEEWGGDVVERIHGMFAFAIWDGKHRTLFLARDRVGKKPLYCYSDSNTFAFASEIKALLEGGFSSRELDPEALDCYFTFGYIPAPKSVFSEIKKLEPATSLVITAGKRVEKQYWSLEFGDRNTASDDFLVEELGGLLDQAVQCRLMSEVPLGAFLSGGIDSSLVVASMAKAIDRPVLTNAIGFGLERYNELPLARQVARFVQADHREYIVEPHAAEVLDEIAWHFDEPFADSSALPTWYVCKMARQNVTVALSGDGGDENFGGYTFRYLPHLVESRIRSAIPVIFRSPLFGFLGAIYPGTKRLPQALRLKTLFENLALSDAEAFYRDLAFLRPEDRQRLYSKDFETSLRGFTPFEMVRPLYIGGDALDPLERSQQADISFYMTDDVLVKVDRMSMAHSLEVRCPLLDHRLMEFAATLPSRLKLNGRAGKAALRKIAARRLPPAVLTHPKHGFEIPAAEWLRGELKGMAHDVIFRRNSIISELFVGREKKRVWTEHQNGARDHSVFLWGLMMFGLWEEKWGQGIGRTA